MFKDVIIDGWIKTKYKVNENGVVINKDNNSIVSIKYDRNYARCSLNFRINGKTIYRLCSIHRIVATAFIPNPNRLPEVNHKDCNPKNNNVNNLEWCDRSYNVTYNDCRDKSRITQQSPITCIFQDKIATYISAHKAAQLCNCSWVSIAEVVRGRKKSLYGSFWRRATNEEITKLANKNHIGDIIDFTPYKRKTNQTTPFYKQFK